MDYFSKEHNRISQETKDTKEMKDMKENSNAQIDQNLFYFIQEHDSS